MWIPPQECMVDEEFTQAYKWLRKDRDPKTPAPGQAGASPEEECLAEGLWQHSPKYRLLVALSRALGAIVSPIYRHDGMPPRGGFICQKS